MLDSGTARPGFKSQQWQSGNSLRQTVHSHCASVHQVAKLVAALLRVVGVTADQLQSPTLGNQVWATFTFLHYITYRIRDHFWRNIICWNKWKRKLKEKSKIAISWLDRLASVMSQFCPPESSQLSLLRTLESLWYSAVTVSTLPHSSGVTMWRLEQSTSFLIVSSVQGSSVFKSGGCA